MSKTRKTDRLLMQAHALHLAEIVERLNWLHLSVPIEEVRLRDRLQKLRDRLAIEAAEKVLAAWRKP
jgi:hypothetical protein